MDNRDIEMDDTEVVDEDMEIIDANKFYSFPYNVSLEKQEIVMHIFRKEDQRQKFMNMLRVLSLVTLLLTIYLLICLLIKKMKIYS